MDGDRFDALARTLGAGRSRRGALKTLLGGALGGAAVVLGANGADAATTVKAPKPQCCPADHPTLCGTPALMCTATPTDPNNCGACGNVCPAGQACQNGACVARTNGQTCTINTQCASGNCADGVCCNIACTGGCQSCNQSGHLGTCTATTTPVASHGGCASDSTACGGTCNGSSGACVYSTAPCRSASCSNGTETLAANCDGAGHCPAPVTQACAPYVCSGTVCATTCASDAGCVSGAYCDTGVTPAVCRQDLGQGVACARNAQCASGNCVDGFCCNSACTGVCQACSQAKTGAANGTCASVTDGTNPNNACVDQGADSCGTNGLCQSGACAFYPSTTTCVAAVCTGSTLTAPRMCDGNGSCAAGSTTSCGTYACNSAGTACNSTCASDQDCAAGNHCSGGTCVAGTTGCTTAADCPPPDQCHTVSCNSGVCQTALKANGTVCTDGNACTLNDTCQNGTCVAGNPVVCTASDQCHNVGTCNSATGACSNPAKADGAACGSGDICCGGGCINVATDVTNCGGCGHVCVATNGTASCVAGTCAIAGCNIGFADCNGSPADGCEVDTRNDSNNCGSCGNKCGAGQTCQNSVCSASAANGQACTTGAQCSSGNCVDSVCCDSACTGACQACSQAKTGGANGTCASVLDGTDPNNSCADQGASSCGHNGLCQSGACAFYPATTTCAAPTCSNGTATPAAMCSGSGTCVTPATTQCAPYLCAGTACATTCANDAGCVVGNFCNSAHQCVPKLPDGGACASDSQCVSGFCVNNLCAAAPCSGCTVNGVCYLTGAANPSNSCQVCNPSFSTSAFSNATNGIGCDDGNPCTVGTACLSGSCVGVAVTCTALDQCHQAGTCNSATGQCSNPLAPDGTTCSIGGGTGHCSAGICVAG